MARQYPRFLFSNPPNTKSKGPFIIHTLYPRGIFRVFTTLGEPDFEIIEFWEPDFTSSKEAEAAVVPLLIELQHWFRAQVGSGTITLHQNLNQLSEHDLFDHFAKKNMVQWNIKGFEKSYPKLYKSVIETIREAKK